MFPYLCNSTVQGSQDMETAQTPTDSGMDKDVAYIYNGILLSHKKE